MDHPADTDTGDGVDALLRRFPLGARTRGRVRAHPAPGIGVFVDLAPEGPAPRARGFVDSEHLRGRDRWPPAGTVTDFEVLRHDVRRAAGTLQIRLWPLDGALRHPRAAQWGLPDGPWQRLKARHPVGSTVTATVTSACAGNRCYTVTFDGAYSRLTHTAAGPPPLGHTGRYLATALLDTTHRVLLAPLTSPDAGCGAPNLNHLYE